ncbi:hypothetical protein HGRIS_009633 [Hohenbuehelia grisea]|uniref:CLASP N-terminal domain-containing protein n=1 Tax=Hohenbuehelia grisea TaxID=104357 RepID=A0ABR3J1W1_9AGAR
MDASSRLDTLINQCRSTDVDVKVDALTKLQAEFETGIEINDPDDVITVFKTCLRTSNNHLSAATVSAILPLIPVLTSRHFNLHQSQPALTRSTSSSTSSTAQSSHTDVATLRQVLTAFLPSGGLVDRLGDKERVQQKAREALVLLGGLAFRSGPSNPNSVKARDGKVETPLMIFERCLKEGGLKSKVWKVREQSILTLVHIRRAHHIFPIRPYLSHLVDALEDTDAHVRDCSRQSVIELFTGPAVTDAARADLKKELTKKNVRKAIVDAVLSKVLGGGAGSNPQSEGSENGDPPSKPKEYIPPSLLLLNRRPNPTAGPSGVQRMVSQPSITTKDVSRPASRAGNNASPTPLATPSGEGADVKPVYIASSRDLENEFAAMQKPFEGKETEHNWADRERSVQRVRGMLKGDVHIRYADVFITCLREGFVQWSLKALASLRTTVAVNTCYLYCELATELEAGIDPFTELMLTNLLRMASFTKRITAQQSQISVEAIIRKGSSQPRIILPLLWNTVQDKNAQARTFGIGHVQTYLEVHAQRARNAIEASGGLEILEKALKKSIVDPNPGVKEKARKCFWPFDEVWHDRALGILEKLDSMARRQVEKACPNPGAIPALPPSTPSVKKSSVAAAIAASRAKAKAIATAPPSLRHQATSASHSPPARRAASPSTPPRASVPRPASPLRMSSSPPSPRSKTTPAHSMSRSVTTSSLSTSHKRTPSGSGPSTSGRVSPMSPSQGQQSTFRRLASSPLVAVGGSANRNSIVRGAGQVPLPASPPSSSGRLSPTPTPTPRPNNASIPRPSVLAIPPTDDESLLLATNIPIPLDDDSDVGMDDSIDLMSFSSPFKSYPPAGIATPKTSPRSNDSHGLVGISNALSTTSIDSQVDSGVPIVEDALRARAEQAESAAERLLELVEPEEEGIDHPTLPTSLLIGNGHATPRLKSVKPMALPMSRAPPITPINRASAIMRQAALFENSPAQNGKTASLMDVLHDRKNESAWWLKRMSLLKQDVHAPHSNPSDKLEELKGYTTALQSAECDVGTLQKIALFCRKNPVTEPTSPLSTGYGSPTSPSPFLTPASSIASLQIDIWGQDKNFENLFDGLLGYMDTEKRSEEELEYSMIILWEMLENQNSHFEGREGDVFNLLFNLRHSNKPNVLEATTTIRDQLTSQIEPVYGLTTMHASLRAFHAEDLPAWSSENVKAATYAFGLIALGKFILRLPAEIAEEELPRLKATLIAVCPYYTPVPVILIA